jgi:hypothetical protein
MARISQMFAPLWPHMPLSVRRAPMTLMVNMQLIRYFLQGVAMLHVVDF